MSVPAAPTNENPRNEARTQPSDPLTFAVVPVPGGWALEQPSGWPLMFLSGARAQAKAKQLAVLAAETGSDVQLLIFDRDGALIAVGRYPPAT